MFNLTRKGASGFSWSSTAEEVTQGVDGSGLTAIVTGATSGIGAETTRVLALRGVHVIMAIRNVELGRNIKEAIVEDIPKAKIDIMQLNLSSLASVRKFAADFNSSGLPLNILINNAGVFATPFLLTEDNIEMQFATNYLGHYLLTHLLLEKLKKTAYKSQIKGRIVIVASEGHCFAYNEGICFDKINDPTRYNRWKAYGQSKLANVLHANELARRLKEDGANVTANSLHPGGVFTNIARDHSFINIVIKILAKFVMKNVQQGAATQCYLALHPQVDGISGEYFSDSNISKAREQGRDMDLAKKLWDFSMDLIK